jgi:hypothetical protein
LIAGVALADTAPNSQPPTIRFKKFVITDDPTYTGMEVTRGIMPADWNLKGGVVWDLRNGRPAQFRIHFSDPQDVAAFDVYPNHFFYWSVQAQQAASIPPDYRYMGSIVQRPPNDQFDALAQVVIARDRPELANAEVVDQTKLPDVAQAAFNNWPKMPGVMYNVAAGRVTFEYQLNNQTVDEEFFLTYKQSINQRLGIMNWSVENVSSLRGQKGSLDQLNMIRAVMAHSCEPNLAWYAKITQFIQMRQQATLAALADQEQRRQIFTNMTSDINDQEKQDFQQHMDDLDRQSDAQADYMRQVSPWKTSDGSEVKLPTQYGHAWEGADGQIIMNNDPLYNPASDPNNTPTQWTPMEQAGQ